MPSTGTARPLGRWRKRRRTATDPLGPNAPGTSLARHICPDGERFLANHVVQHRFEPRWVRQPTGGSTTVRSRCSTKQWPGSRHECEQSQRYQVRRVRLGRIRDVATTGSAVPSKLQTSKGNTTISDSAVQKIAGVSAREVSGVYALGGGAARTIGALRERIPGSSQSAGQGVAVEVGERQAAIDLDIVTEYGVSIVDLSRAVRRNVIEAVEGMTGLEVTEVNVAANDIHLPGD